MFDIIFAKLAKVTAVNCQSKVNWWYSCILMFKVMGVHNLAAGVLNLSFAVLRRFQVAQRRRHIRLEFVKRLLCPPLPSTLKS